MPGGDRQGDSVVRAFCGAVEWGSSALVFVLRSPVLALMLAVFVMVGSAVLASRSERAHDAR